MYFYFESISEKVSLISENHTIFFLSVFKIMKKTFSLFLNSIKSNNFELKNGMLLKAIWRTFYKLIENFDILYSDIFKLDQISHITIIDKLINYFYFCFSRNVCHKNIKNLHDFLADISRKRISIHEKKKIFC